MCSIRLDCEPWLGCARHQICDGAQNTTAARHLPKQKTADGGKKQIGHPHAEKRREFSLPAERDSGVRKNVVEQYQQNGKDQAGTLSAAPRNDTERNANQHQNKTCSRIGKTRVATREEIFFHPGRACAASSAAHGQSVDGSIHAAQVHFALRTQR